MREAAYRVSAAELDGASLSYSKSDEECAPNHVVTPTGMRLNRTFVAGVLTEVEHANNEVFHGRIMDPTGAFVTYAGQHQPEPMVYLDAATPSAPVSLAGEARTYEPDSVDMVYSLVRSESVNTVDADVRDRWIVSAAETTLRRIVVFDETLSMPCRGDDLTHALEARGVDSVLAAGIPRAIDHYGAARTHLEALYEVAVQALESVAGGHDQVDPLDVVPGDGGDAVLGPLSELDPEPAVSVDIEVDEADVDEVEADAGEFESESSSELAAMLDSEPEFDDGAESEAVEPESKPESITEPDSESEPTSDPELVATETTIAAEDQPGTSESEPVSEPSTTTDSEPESKPTAEPESEPAAEPGFMSEPEPGPVTDSPDTEPGLSFDDGALGDFEDDALNASTTGAGSLDDSGSGTLGDFDDDFGDPSPKAGDSTGLTSSTSVDTDDSVNPNGMYEFDENERAEIESEFGTEFTSSADVDPAGEADTDVFDVDGLTEQLEDESTATTESDPEPAIAVAEPEPTVDSEPEPMSDAVSDGGEDETDANPGVDESAKGIDLEPAAMSATDGLDDGDGATRGKIVTTVADERSTDPGAVEDVIQEMPLDGRCYEPQDSVLRAI